MLIDNSWFKSSPLASHQTFHQNFSHFNTEMDLYKSPGPISIDETPKLQGKSQGPLSSKLAEGRSIQDGGVGKCCALLLPWPQQNDSETTEQPPLRVTFSLAEQKSYN